METAIPINHSFVEEQEFLEPPKDSMAQDRSVAELTEHPGWKIYAGKVNNYINQLNQLERYDGEPFEQYGVRMYAAQQVRKALEWAIDDVEATRRSVANIDDGQINGVI